MKQFAKLFEALDQSTKTNDKVNALAHYFSLVTDSDKLWTIALLSHKRPKRTVPVRAMAEWAAEISGLPDWLFRESYHIVGDFAEAVALTLPPPQKNSEHSLTHWIQYIQALKTETDAFKKEAIISAWDQLNYSERFVFNKLITGGFRMGVSQKLMTKALSKYTGIDENVLSHKIMGDWSPENTTFELQILSESVFDDLSKPYPFYLAYALDKTFVDLGDLSEWQVERKWDGIRGQLIKREGRIFVWSRGEDLVTHQYPEFTLLETLLPDGTVLDGEILPVKEGEVLSFQNLQKRIGRKSVSKNIMKKYPVVLRCYDLLEHRGQDIRSRPLSERRNLLEGLVDLVQQPQILDLSETVKADSWEELQKLHNQSREHRCEGMMLKLKSSVYKTGRKKGEWWKWKIAPLVIDAVMIYAMRGHGRRANLFSDFTFAVWDGDTLVPFAKAYSGLTDKEFNEITNWVRKNTVERFGPVRAVTPTLVFELAFEGIQKSSRHKSGIALRFPRIKRWRKDKHPKEANKLDDLKDMLDQFG